MTWMRWFKNRQIQRDDIKTPDINEFRQQIGRNKSCMV